jgi:hypothetical protein
LVCGLVDRQVYLILLLTSTFLPFLIGVLLYTLLKPRFSPESAQQLQERLLAGVKKQEEIDRAKQDKVDKKKSKANNKKNKNKSKGRGIFNTAPKESSDSESSSSESDTETTIDLLDKTRDVSEKINQATVQAALRLKKKGKAKLETHAGKSSTGSKVKLFGAWETFQREHGAQIQLVLNDLADMHEKVIKCVWRVGVTVLRKDELMDDGSTACLLGSDLKHPSRPLSRVDDRAYIIRPESTCSF